MNYYFAPLEGVNGYIYRNTYHEFFSDMDKYFAPFIAPHSKRSFKPRELWDLLPENNQGIVLVPQILTNNADDFIQTARDLKQFGYGEVNLNLGCPSGTVVAKNKGAGFLDLPWELDRFLEKIFSEATTKISIKTRLGMEQEDEFYELMHIFNKYPLEELIIHPRVRTDYYKNKPHLEVFKDALASSKNSVCYNGDIFTQNDYQKFITNFPSVEKIMLGRGMISNPGLLNEITSNEVLDKKLLKEFHDKVYSDYKDILFGDRNILFRMKELWSYMSCIFTNSDKYAKKIRKSEILSDYDEVVMHLFKEQELVEGSGFIPI